MQVLGALENAQMAPRVITTGANKQSETAPAAAWYLLCSLNNPYGQCKEATNICVVYAVSVILSVCANNRSKRLRGIRCLCDQSELCVILTISQNSQKLPRHLCGI